MTIEDAIRGRQSVRAFLKTPVPRDVINRVNDIHFTSKDEIHTLGHMYETMLREMRDAAGDSGVSGPDRNWSISAARTGPVWRLRDGDGSSDYGAGAAGR